MAAALRRLPQQTPAVAVVVPGLLDGLDNVDRLVAPLARAAPRRRVARARRA